MTKELLKEFEALIIEKMRETKAICKELREAIKELDSSRGADDGDVSSAINERDILQIQLCRGEKLMDELKAAQHRCWNGTYGICQASGKPIAEKRLRQHLCATFGVAAKLEMKAKEGEAGNRLNF